MRYFGLLEEKKGIRVYFIRKSHVETMRCAGCNKVKRNDQFTYRVGKNVSTLMWTNIVKQANDGKKTQQEQWSIRSSNDQPTEKKTKRKTTMMMKKYQCLDWLILS